MVLKRTRKNRRNKKGRGDGFQTLYPSLPSRSSREIDKLILEEAEALTPMDNKNGYIFGGPNVIEDYEPIKKGREKENIKLIIDDDYFSRPNKGVSFNFKGLPNIPKRTKRLNSKSLNPVKVNPWQLGAGTRKRRKFRRSKKRH